MRKLLNICLSTVGIYFCWMVKDAHAALPAAAAFLANPAFWGGAAKAASVAAPMLGGLFGGKKKQQSVGPQVVTMPQYSFTEPRMRLTSDFISDNINRMQMGKNPAYYDQALPKLREGMQRGMRQAYFGDRGARGPGILQTAAGAGSVFGVGPKASMAQVNKHLYDYGTKEQEIDEYLTKMGVDINTKMATQMPMLSNQMPKGPDAQVLGGYALPSSGGNMGETLSSLGENLPGMLDSVGGFFENQNPRGMYDTGVMGNMFGGGYGNVNAYGGSTTAPVGASQSQINSFFPQMQAPTSSTISASAAPVNAVTSGTWSDFNRGAPQAPLVGGAGDRMRPWEMPRYY